MLLMPFIIKGMHELKDMMRETPNRDPFFKGGHGGTPIKMHGHFAKAVAKRRRRNQIARASLGRNQQNLLHG